MITTKMSIFFTVVQMRFVYSLTHILLINYKIHLHSYYASFI